MNAHHTPATDPQPGLAATVTDAATMTTALQTGAAVTLTPIVTNLARHNDQWWLNTGDEWLLITDPRLAADLDRHHGRQR
jgi:hypothetical protein